MRARLWPRLAAVALAAWSFVAFADTKGGSALFHIDGSWSEILVGSRLAGCFGVSAEISSDAGLSLTPGVSWDFQVKAATVSNLLAGRLAVDAVVVFDGREGWVDPGFVAKPPDWNRNGRLDDGEVAGSTHVSLSETHRNVCRELLQEIGSSGTHFDILGYHIAYPHSTLDPALLPASLKRADGSVDPERALEIFRKDGRGWIIVLEIPDGPLPTAALLAELDALAPEARAERLQALGARLVIRRP